MRFIFIVLSLFTVACGANNRTFGESSSVATTAQARIHDIVHPFLSFWDGARSLPLTEQVTKFKVEVVPTF